MATFGPHDIPVPVSPTDTGATTRFVEATTGRLRTEFGTTTQGMQQSFTQEPNDIKREINDKLGGAYRPQQPTLQGLSMRISLGPEG